MRRLHDLPILVLLLAAVPGCDGCHGSKPYTPYTLSDTPSAGQGTAPRPPASSPEVAGHGGSAGPGFAAAPATAAPGDGKRWEVEGGVAEPPPGHAFAEGLVFDADGDQKPDLLAWARAPDGLRGEIWFASGKSPAAGRTVAALPGDLAGPGCSPSVALTRIGASMVVFDFDPRCGPRAHVRSARWIAVFRLASGGPPELGLELRLGAPADGESFAVAIDGRDRDGDGRGDFAATVSLTGAPRPIVAGGTAAAAIAFFDRPAGLSRDPSEPEASLKSLAAALVADGRRRTTAPRIAAAAGAARRLHALLCEEGGHPVITTSAGPVRCGESRFFEDADMAEVEAALNLGDPLAALGRIDNRRKDLEALVSKSIPSIAGKRSRTASATPDVQPPPAFGPLAFNGAGDVLVHTRDKVVRIDRTSFEESPVDAPPKWPTRLSWPADAPTWTLASVEQRCDAPTLIARFERAGGEGTDVPLPILTPARCTASSRLPVDFLGPTPQGSLLAVRGDVVAVPRDGSPRPAVAESLASPPGAVAEPGAGRSPNGTVIALATSRGVLVASLKGQGRGASAKLWTAPAADGASACVPNDTADRLACVVKGAAAIYDAK